ncbi:hypothetical protein CRM22_006911 [Opisthorchis felineus]|uniref:LIM zinc-binding domain-containing protein n=1 Tax=Opisthorchis felineus TaxID=147828 RepID=A0A4S2LRP9_OPIFE|nr:hypothetical protein CRM22_006911 [Opisthorchis felineus]TGZ63467.1 hypothetical protein CRM22_006911 [Opisthorchis felineus]
MDEATCKKCNERCLGDIIRTENGFYHYGCFTCTVCGTHLGRLDYYQENGLLYCEEDIRATFRRRCASCGCYVSENSVSVFDKIFHQSCFYCYACKNIFTPGMRVTLWKKKFYCTACFDASYTDNINMTSHLNRPYKIEQRKINQSNATRPIDQQTNLVSNVSNQTKSDLCSYFCQELAERLAVQYNACQMHVADGSKSKHASGDSTSLNLEDEQLRSDLRPSHQSAKYDKNSEKLVTQLGTEASPSRIKTQRWRHSSENSTLEDNYKASVKSCNTHSGHSDAGKSSGFKKTRIGKVATIVKFLEELIKQPDTVNLDSYCKKEANSPAIHEHPKIRRQIYATLTCTENKHDQNGTRPIDKCLPISADAFEMASVSREKSSTSTPRQVKNFEYRSKGAPSSPQMDLSHLARPKVHHGNARVAESSGTLESLVPLQRRSIFKATPLSEIRCSETTNESLDLNTQEKTSRDQTSVEKHTPQTNQPDTNNLRNLKRLEMLEQEQPEIVNRLLRNTEGRQGESTADRSRKSVKINGISGTLINESFESSILCYPHDNSGDSGRTRSFARAGRRTCYYRRRMLRRLVKQRSWKLCKTTSPMNLSPSKEKEHVRLPN